MMWLSQKGKIKFLDPILFGCDTNGCTDFTDFTDSYGFFVPQIRMNP
ncbi:MAG: hypothetical protein RLZZ628_1396 [Bacteroidota bacterium]|jgi:hypothetical protein